MSALARIEAIVDNEVAAVLEINHESAANAPMFALHKQLELYRACVAGLLAIPSSNVTLRVCGKGFDYHF